uniref:Eukaryotic translation initiation factor 6 n=1 Tax=Aotus nancymaae TaxID=37293 RepID=A0A2K5DRM4_AOTNA
MAVRASFENNCEIGCFAKLTNTYCLVAIGGSENFYSVFEGELSDTIPVVHASIAGCRIIGRMCVGDRRNSGRCAQGGSLQTDSGRPGASRKLLCLQQSGRAGASQDFS